VVSVKILEQEEDWRTGGLEHQIGRPVELTFR